MLLRYPGYRRVACVVVGEPVESFKSFSRELLLRAKQEALHVEYRSKVLEERRRQDKAPVEGNDSRKATWAVGQWGTVGEVQDALKRKAETERRRREAEARGEAFEEDAKGGKVPRNPIGPLYPTRHRPIALYRSI